MVFSVQSSRKAGVRYRVDLTAQKGFGECSCIDWGTRRHPAIKAGGKPGTRETMCRHVIAARRHFLNTLLADMAESEGER